MEHPRAYPVIRRGFSLVELMVSITIGLILLAGATMLFVQNSETRSELEKSSRQIENGRYAVQLLSDDLHLAGFYGEYFLSNVLSAPPTILPDPCDTTPASLASALPLPVQGYDSPATVPAPLSACLPDANHVPGTDILVVRRAATNITPIGSLSPSEVYIQTNPTAFVINTGANVAAFNLTKKDGTTPADIRKYMVHIYFVSPCSMMSNGTTCQASDDSGNPIPTLKRLELTTNGTSTVMKAVPLVEGIENLQIDYGVDTTPTTVDLGTGWVGDGVPDSYTTAPADTNAWNEVVTARINVLARNTEPTVGYVDTKTYNLGLAGNVTPGNAYKHHVFTALVRLTNPDSRRER